MRRSTCVCEPNHALAGNSGTWKFIYTTANTLPKDTKLRFDLGGGGRPFDWQIPQVNPKEKEKLEIKRNEIFSEIIKIKKSIEGRNLTSRMKHVEEKKIRQLATYSKRMENSTTFTQRVPQIKSFERLITVRSRHLVLGFKRKRQERLQQTALFFGSILSRSSSTFHI